MTLEKLFKQSILISIFSCFSCLALAFPPRIGERVLYRDEDYNYIPTQIEEIKADQRHVVITIPWMHVLSQKVEKVIDSLYRIDQTPTGKRVLTKTTGYGGGDSLQLGYISRVYKSAQEPEIILEVKYDFYCTYRNAGPARCEPTNSTKLCIDDDYASCAIMEGIRDNHRINLVLGSFIKPDGERVDETVNGKILYRFDSHKEIETDQGHFLY